MLAGLAGAAAASLLPGAPGAAPGPRLVKPIPSTGERLPAIGMGTWLTFDVGDVAHLRRRRAEVLRAFFAAGGGVVDSSPMYGSAEAVVGDCLARLPEPRRLFAATKVWTPLGAMGPGQMDSSRRLWGVPRFDLMQVHNLLAWESHLATLRARKAAGDYRYIGVTTSHGRRHGTLARIMEREPLDFVQLTYNILDRDAEARLLPLAAERGLAVIANRPFRTGALFDHVGRAPLPGWAAEIGAATWAQVFLKWIVAHPALTCAIPATTRVDHMEQNMAAALGPLPDTALRARMAREVADL
ncbi:MAG: aldo/keto reductase [Hyphomicrobiales bacterium]|nr:aldo/keto reductase [Hyphomicrobiales bacterium]